MRLLVLPATIVTAGMLLCPLFLMFRISLNRFDPIKLMEAAVTPENYINVLTDRFYQEVMAVTVGVALISTLLTLMFAFPVAYWLARLESRWKGVLVILVILPLLVGNVIRLAGWIAILGSEGALNYMLQRLGLISSRVQFLYTFEAVIVGSVSILIPYMIIVVSSVIENIPREVEEAAMNLGAHWSTTFRRVIFPMAWPGVVSGCVLVFILTMNAYATPVLLGGPKFTMMAPAIYDEYMKANNWPLGAAVAFILLLVTGVLVGMATLVPRRTA